MSTQTEIWRVSTPEGVFEADLETLKQWIREGCVLTTDKVSKGNLNWIEAGRAPMLRAAFSGEVSPVTTTAQVAEPPQVVEAALPPPATQSESYFENFVETPRSPEASSPETCCNHPELSTKYFCHTCNQGFCQACTRFVGTNKIALCPVCGDLCKLFEQEQRKVKRQAFQSSGFGFQDFGRAIRYPLQHKSALLFGAAIYGFLLLGGFKGRILASVIMFGCISHVISQVAWGRLHRSFMPDFSAFSLWDDLVMPIFLGIGITIVTWGPTIALVLVFIFGVIGGTSLTPTTEITEAEIRGNTLTQEDIAVLADPEADPKKLEEANRKLNQTRPGAQIAQEAERSTKGQNDPTAPLREFLPYLQVSIIFVLLLLVSIAWAIFYYPMALAVAGYTESFGSVLNPLVGLDTIRRMRGTYFKAFGMVLMVQIVGSIVGIIVAVITSPFALPFVGNLPAMFIDGSLTFYFNLVIACVLGLALHKCADRLGIATA